MLAPLPVLISRAIVPPPPRRHSSSPPFRGGVEFSWNKHLYSLPNTANFLVFVLVAYQ